MIRELFRPLLRWLFWNRRRPLLILAALLIGAVILGRLTGCGAGSAAHAPAPAASATVQAASPAAWSSAAPAPAQPSATATAAAQGTPATPAPAGPAPAAALQAARAFLQAWVSRDAGRDAAIRAAATPQLAAQVTGPAAAMAPATEVDGPLTVTGQAAGTVSVSAPTNAGAALLTVRLDAGRWLAAQVMLAGTGD